LKCGEVKPNEAFLSTNLARAYTDKSKNTNKALIGYENKKRELDKELGKWSSEKMPILRIVVTPSVEEKAGNVLDTRSKIQKRQKKANAQTNCPEYFLHCGKDQTELLFGGPFARFLQIVREEKQSLSEIRKDDDEGDDDNEDDDNEDDDNEDDDEDFDDNQEPTDDIT
jgi:hypothetical protein